MILYLLVDFIVISPVSTNRAKQVRIVRSLMPVSSLNAFLPVTN